MDIRELIQSLPRRSSVIRLASILRLANSFDLSHERKVLRLHVTRLKGTLIVRGEGYSELGPTAERVAAARYLLEINCHMPILVRSWTDSHKHIIATSQSRHGQ